MPLTENRLREIANNAPASVSEIGQIARELLDHRTHEKPTTLVDALLHLPLDLRLEVFGHFCTHCGTEDPRCQCWNDE